MNGVISQEFRKCLNRKSRTNPDVQCPLSATQGDYCSRHFKNPRPFTKKTETLDTTRMYTRSEHNSIKKIQRFWKCFAPYRRFFLQGPAVNAPDIAINSTELYSLEPIHTISPTYFISFSDNFKAIWVFDIRTLVQTMATGFPSQNPYNRVELTPRAKDKIHRRIEWLRSRKYNILHVSTDILTPVQAWNQAVLDIFLKIESLGFYVSCEWYHNMNITDHMNFYKKLYELWNWRLNLSRAEKEVIVPGHMSGISRIFRFDPSDKIEKGTTWWEKSNLNLISSFITRAHDKENRKLGAMYILMALVQVSSSAAISLPWILEDL